MLNIISLSLFKLNSLIELLKELNSKFIPI